ncbi:DUF397 domain-containing protein [Haloactinomyces albus]|uniref:DUF397 domain-containing protein n=1 Tax=Haloactinomyces albus TaxID=1352928 RepID=A0AAE3ZHF5_9ACTN|nr:DUF397 domain-containing protein [Haloactinomyces albus]MDR7302999.1 hypothetical protein [Haloactinomyces albus]
MSHIGNWRTSTRTQGQGQCVEVGFGGAGIGVRDTKNRAAGHLIVPPRQWHAFVRDLKRGVFES